MAVLLYYVIIWLAVFTVAGILEKIIDLFFWRWIP